MTLAIRNASKSIGTNDAKSEGMAADIRKAYQSAKTDEAQREIRIDFYIGYIAGRDRTSIADAEAIVTAGKGKDAINAPAIVRAVAAWNYHVLNGGAKPEPKQSKRNRVSSEARTMAMDFLANFEGDTLDAQIKAAIALLNALK